MSRLYGQPFATVPEWLLDADVSDRAVRLFATLSRHANREGRAFPGRRGLADRLRCSLATLDRAIAELVEAEALVVRPAWRADGGQTSNNYWLWPSLPDEGEPQDGPTPSSTGEAGGGRTDEEGKGNESQVEREPENERLFDGSAAAPAELPGPSDDELFEEFWAACPKRTGKGEARKAYGRALKRASAAAILEGMRRYAEETRGTEPRFLKTPGPWLNADRWLDEPGANRRQAPARTGARQQVGQHDGPAGRVVDL